MEEDSGGFQHFMSPPRLMTGKRATTVRTPNRRETQDGWIHPESPLRQPHFPKKPRIEVDMEDDPIGDFSEPRRKGKDAAIEELMCMLPKLTRYIEYIRSFGDVNLGERINSALTGLDALTAPRSYTPPPGPPPASADPITRRIDDLTATVASLMDMVKAQSALIGKVMNSGIPTQTEYLPAAPATPQPRAPLPSQNATYATATQKQTNHATQRAPKGKHSNATRPPPPAHTPAQNRDAERRLIIVCEPKVSFADRVEPLLLRNCVNEKLKTMRNPAVVQTVQYSPIGNITIMVKEPHGAEDILEHGEELAKAIIDDKSTRVKIMLDEKWYKVQINGIPTKGHDQLPLHIDQVIEEMREYDGRRQHPTTGRTSPDGCRHLRREI